MSQASGRVRHEHKITVYLTAEELHRLEVAAAAIRYRHGVRADRGRIVRDALGLVLDDFESSRGTRMPRIVQRLREIR